MVAFSIPKPCLVIFVLKFNIIKGGNAPLKEAQNFRQKYHTFDVAKKTLNVDGFEKYFNRTWVTY